MKIIRKFFKLIFIAAGTIAALLAALLIWICNRPAVPTGYTKEVKTGGPLESAYLAMGSHKVKRTEFKAPKEYEKYEIYYPADMEQGGGPYPAVVFVNGTGILASKYPALFKHLASWGFIVLGNEDPGTWSGRSADLTLACLLEQNENKDSIFYQKVDLANIGISGHSQGGAGVFNAVTANEHSGLYKACASLSPTNEEGAAQLKMPYDLTQVKIPVLMLAGTGDDFETKLVIPIEQMEKMYGRLSVPKVMARRRGSGHGQMLYEGDGYVTAWFMYWLRQDEKAGQAFFGSGAELARNPLWQDVRIDLDGQYISHKDI